VNFTQQIIKITLVTCLLLTFNIQAAEQVNPVELNVIKKTVVYGKSLNIEVKTLTKENINISSLLKPLENNFLYSITNSDTAKRYTRYKIKLAPLQPEINRIPSLYYKQYKTQPVNINVTSPLSKTGQPVSVKLEHINSKPWVREQTSLIVTIITTDRNIILNNKNIQHKGSKSYLIPQSSKKMLINSQVFYKHRIGWNIFFLYEQIVNLSLPEIEYIKDGVPRYKFRFRKVKLNIKKLPVYVNPTIPVGKISLSARYLELPKILLQPDMTAIIQYSLVGNGIPAKWLPSLSQKYLITHNADINFSHITTKLETKTTTNVLGRKLSDIAFTPKSNGLLPIKNIQLQYFDPETGLLKSVNYKHKPLLVLQGLLQIILILFMLAGIYLFISKTACFLGQWLKKHKHRLRCRSSLKRAETFSDIRLALQDFSMAEKWPVNVSLNQWLSQVQNKYITPANLQKICNSLNNNLYAMGNQPETDELEAIKESLLDILIRLKKKPRKINVYFSRLQLS